MQAAEGVNGDLGILSHPRALFATRELVIIALLMLTKDRAVAAAGVVREEKEEPGG